MLPAGDKSEVHQTQTSFISYVVPWYMRGKENVSLCLAMQQGRKAAEHCSSERALLLRVFHQLRVIYTPPGAS